MNTTSAATVSTGSYVTPQPQPTQYISSMPTNCYNAGPAAGNCNIIYGGQAGGYQCGAYNYNTNNNSSNAAVAAIYPHSTTGYANASTMLGIWNQQASTARYYVMRMGGANYIYHNMNGAAYVPAAQASPYQAYTTGIQSGGTTQQQQQQQQQQQAVEFVMPAGQPALYHDASTPLQKQAQPVSKPSSQSATTPQTDQYGAVSPSSASSTAATTYQRKTVHKVPTTLRITLSSLITEEYILSHLSRPNIGVRRDAANELLYVEFSHVRDCAEVRTRLEQLNVSCETELTSEKDTTNIYITGIPDTEDFDSNVLRSYFKQFGTVQSTKIVERNGLERVGFVRFQRPEEATTAVRCVDLVIEGKHVSCKYANKTRGAHPQIPTTTTSVAVPSANATGSVGANGVVMDPTQCAPIAAGSGVMDCGVMAAAMPCFTILPQTGYSNQSATTPGYHPMVMGTGGTGAYGNVGVPMTPQMYSAMPYWNAYAAAMPNASQMAL